jgi:hypothetical protein
MELAKIKESQGDITDAANILQELQVLAYAYLHVLIATTFLSLYKSKILM